MKLDLHIHSVYSGDSSSRPEEIIKTADKKGMDGIAIADHNSIEGYLEAKKLESDMIVVPQVEVSTPEGHVLGLGLQEDIGRQSTIVEAIEKIREHGALAVAAHPHRFWSGIGKKNVLENTWDCIEGMNGRSWGIRNRQAQRLAEKLDLPITGGSDSHRLKTVGKAYTILEKVDTWEDVIQKVKKGKTEVGGKGRTFTQTFFYIRRALSGWVKRGFKRI
ncbi:MAG: PHP domain-containing protein [Candidatus Thermoplasmatota archaeon]|nr:PHP domain-containing protein [Candidatus Thermoplasmatota archaeon]